jgi:hypothetical protein
MTSNLRVALETFLREQSERISAVPRAQPGSYYRGYDNGMSDILSGLQAVLARTTDETTDDCGGRKVALLTCPNCNEQTLPEGGRCVRCGHESQVKTGTSRSIPVPDETMDRSKP